MLKLWDSESYDIITTKATGLINLRMDIIVDIFKDNRKHVLFKKKWEKLLKLSIMSAVKVFVKAFLVVHEWRQ